MVLQVVARAVTVQRLLQVCLVPELAAVAITAATAVRRLAMALAVAVAPDIHRVLQAREAQEVLAIRVWSG